MKFKELLSLTILSILFISHVCSQVYVKHDALGANNGTSWSDAYTNLQTALDASSAGDQIWISAGTYKPTITGDTVDAYFQFNHDLQLYGGFAGTETNLTQRDWIVNECILSGDHLGNDNEGIGDEFRTDNSKHIFWLTDTITNATIFDGLTISNGNTEGGDGSGNDRRGGGVLTYGAPIVRNCTFKNNYGYFGGGIYPRGSRAAGVQILDCMFESNRAQFGAGVYVNSTTAMILRSTFMTNMSVSLGGGIYNGTSGGAQISECTFIQNSSVDSRAGGIYCTGSPSTISNCMFERNRAVNSTGGAIHVRNSDDTDPFVSVDIINCVFDRNEARWGGAVGVYDKKCIANIIDCTFTTNSSSTAGGATTNGFGANTNFSNCTFTQNNSEIGGAIYNQNDSSLINIDHCSFSENSATDRGGCINISGGNEPEGTQPIPQVNISNTVFLGNTALAQAGAINISNANLNITNSLFALNFVINTDGIGGAISLNTSDSITTNYVLTNNTIVLNTADIGAGVANWQQDETAVTTLTIQNTIFDNPDGENYTIEAGNPSVLSNGGNLSSDASLSSYFTNTNDDNDTAPGFIDPYLDYHLLDISPCVNRGIDDGAPTTDLDGNPRHGTVDKGAYENQNVVGVVNRTEQNFGTLNVYPIPAIDEIVYTLENNWSGVLTIKVTDAAGRIVLKTNQGKFDLKLRNSLNIEALNDGVYFLQIVNGSNYSTSQFIKG